MSVAGEATSVKVVETPSSDTSWYKTKRVFTPTELAYIDFLEQTFLVQNEFKEWVPYQMTDYQKEFHADSINIKLQEAEDILFIKARGISFTWSSLIDLIVTGTLFDETTLPIIAQREGTALKHVKTAQSIIKHCKLKEIKDACEFTNSTITFTKTKSSMEAYPSSSAADAVRGMRLITGLIDEAAFQDRDEELMAAFQDAISGSLGQIKMGSTPNGRNNMFFTLVDSIRKGQQMGFKLYELPVFDHKKFNPNQLPSAQNLVPVAPWISLKSLDKKWLRNKEIFMQENMCDFLDDSLALIPYTTIAKAIDEGIQNHKEIFYKNGNFVYNTKNPIYIGVDVAEKRDYFAVVAFEEVFDEKSNTIVYVERWLDYFNGVQIPELEQYLNRLFIIYPTLVKMRIDSTGIGTSLPSYLKKNHGSKVEGINFSTSVSTEDAKGKTGIRTVMCTNLKRVFEDKQILIFNDGLQTKHLGSVDYSFSAARNADGHSDIFFAIALALLKSRYTINGQATAVASPISETPMPKKEFKDMNVLERIEFYKRQGQANKRW